MISFTPKSRMFDIINRFFKNKEPKFEFTETQIATTTIDDSSMIVSLAESSSSASSCLSSSSSNIPQAPSSPSSPSSAALKNNNISIQVIPPEIFIKICEYLPPLDLLTLTGVCKRFRGFLCSSESFITQDIWRASRVKFLPSLQLPPPEGMFEEEYVRFGNLLKSCQYCLTKKRVKVYWQFRVRCCEECLMDNTIPTLFNKDQTWMNDKVLEGLVYVHHKNQVLFWTLDVKSSFREYEVISGNKFLDWIEKRKENRIKTMEDALQRDVTVSADEKPCASFKSSRVIRR